MFVPYRRSLELPRPSPIRFAALAPLAFLLDPALPCSAERAAGAPPPGAYAYVTMPGSASAPGAGVARIDTATYAVEEIAVGSMPMGLAVSPDGSAVFVANASSGSLSVIDTAAGSVASVIPTGGVPLGVVADRAGEYVYVTDPGESLGAETGRVIVIRAPSRAVEAEIPAGRYPLGADLSPDDSILAVGNYADSAVALYDTANRSPVGEIARDDGLYPYDVKFGPGGGALYIAYSGDGSNDHVRAVDPWGRGCDLYYDGVGQAPVSICFDPAGAGLFVSNSHHPGLPDTDNLYSCMLRTPGYASSARIPDPGIGAFTPDGRRLFLPCRSRNSVAVFAHEGGALTLFAEIPLPGAPYAAAIAQSRPAAGAGFVGAHLYANPQEASPGGTIYLSWSLLPPADAAFAADVLLGVVDDEGRCFAFGPSLKQLRPVDPEAIGSIPRFVSGFPVGGPASGWIGIGLRGGVPAGAYRFIAALVSPPGSSGVVYSTVSNRFPVI